MLGASPGPCEQVLVRGVKISILRLGKGWMWENTSLNSALRRQLPLDPRICHAKPFPLRIAL